MKVQFHGHACFSIFTDDGTHLLIDPFLSGNQQAKISPDDVNPDAILLTHGHWDHIGDTVAIAQRTGCLVVCVPEIISYLKGKGLSNFHGMNIGGSFPFGAGSIKMTPALHSSGLEENGQVIYMGNPVGFLLKYDGKIIYHAGDTGLSYEMTLLGNANKIDLALLPVGDNYTMDVHDAMLAARALRARHVVPMHYFATAEMEQNVNLFSNLLLNFGIPCTVLAPEESMEL